MIHVLFITVYVLLTPVSGGSADIVQIREYPQPFTSLSLCEREAKVLKITEEENLLRMNPEYTVRVQTVCRPKP